MHHPNRAQRALPLLSWALLAALTNCTASQPQPSSPTWPSLTESVGIFAFTFPEGDATRPALAAALHSQSSPDAAAACNLYRSDAAAPGDFAFVAVKLNNSQVGRYSVSPSGLEKQDFAPNQPLVAQVTLTQVVDGKGVSKINALAGSVDVVAAPQTVAQWSSDAVLQLRLSVHVPLEPKTLIECSGGGTDDVSQPSSNICTCRNADASISTCVPATPGSNCCLADGPTQIWAQDLTASACAALCYAPPLSYQLCTTLQ